MAVPVRVVALGLLAVIGFTAEAGTAPRPPRSQPGDFVPEVMDLMAAQATTQAAAHRDLRAFLSAELTRARDQRDPLVHELLTQRLDQLPPEVPGTAELPAVAAPPEGPRRTSPALDAWAKRAREVADGTLAERVRPLAEELTQAMEQAERAGDSPRQRQLWLMLVGLPHPWTEVPTRPIPGQAAYGRQEALPLPRLPAYLEVTIEPGGHDLHIGVGGQEDEDVTEIYLGGWYGHGSGIRTAPGGDEVTSRSEFRGFLPERPDPLAVPGGLLDPWQGLSFSPYQPTVIRLAIAPAGLVVTRLERGRFLPFMATDRLFNHPTCLMLRSDTYRVLSLRVHPAAAWTDLTKVPAPAPAKPSKF